MKCRVCKGTGLMKCPFCKGLGRSGTAGFCGICKGNKRIKCKYHLRRRTGYLVAP